MPSPFPGMNPYLEQEGIWPQFHGRFIFAVADALTAQLDPRYLVMPEEQLFIHEAPAEQRRLIGRADAAISPAGPVGPGEPAGRSASATIAAPLETTLPDADVVRQFFLEIRDHSGGDVIAVVELLSPSNKRVGPDRDAYLRKRLRLLRSRTHLVEIDLLRGGPRMPSDGLPPCDYTVMVSRAERRPRAETWALTLRERLPVIPVPLRPPDADARLDLQECLHRVYDAARYGTYLYRGEPDPPLSPADQAWAQSLVATPAGATGYPPRS
jgi:hypothetical protein